MLLLFSFLFANLLKEQGHSQKKIIMYFSPLCPACYQFKFKDPKHSLKKLSKKYAIVYHPLLIHSSEKEQTAILCILYKKYAHTKKITPLFLEDLRKLMFFSDYWRKHSQDNIEKLLAIIKPDVRSHTKIPDDDPLICVQLAALAAGFTHAEIAEGLSDKQLEQEIIAMVNHPKRFQGKQLVSFDETTIENLPAFDIGEKSLIQDPETFVQKTNSALFKRRTN